MPSIPWKHPATLAFLAATGLAVLSFAVPRPGGQAPDPAEATDPAETADATALDDPPAPGAAEDARAILDLMGKTYAGAGSYEDEGEVVTRFSSWWGKRTVSKPFETRFVRPGLFRYQYKDRPDGWFSGPNLYVIWSDAAPKVAKTWWTLRPEVEIRSLDHALAAAAGVSSGTSMNVPGLLMPEIWSRSYLLQLEGARTIGEGASEGIPCRKVAGRSRGGGRVTLWVDKRTHLLRKIEMTKKFSDFSTAETTTYRPRLNPDLPADRFRFEPPKP